MSPVLVAAFNTVMSARAIHSVYQPVVALADRAVVGFEALARGPAGTIWHSPEALVNYAAQVGRLPELDWICRAAAVRGALDARLSRDVPLFVNVEPASARIPCPRDLARVINAGVAELQLVAELTERSLATDPAALLQVVERLRLDTHRIALDDVGADPSSQALMPLLHPDVIKLDRGVVQHPETSQAKAVMDAVREQAEQTGALVLAEGIETEEDLAVARQVGATLGQGYLLGRPGPLPRQVTLGETRLPVLTVQGVDADTPFTIARRHLSPTRVDVAAVASASRLVEAHGTRADQPSVLLATFQEARRFDSGARSRYAKLAEQQALAAVYAAGMPTELGAKLRGCSLESDDPLTREWNVLVISAHASAGVFAVEIPGPGPRQFDMILTWDRELVVAAARPLLRRLAPAPPTS
jgi:EAL domain-containing protein (putative c-di-GMP-specific phosphodiesterase class I)